MNDSFKFNVAGVQHHQIHLVMDELEQDVLASEAYLELVPEPSNNYDPNAIRLEFDSKVLGRQVMIGYVPKKIAPLVGALMVKGQDENFLMKCKVIDLWPHEVPWKAIKVLISKEEQDA